MHQPIGAHHFAPKRHRQGLMAQTDAQHRNAPGKVSDGVHRNAGLFGGTGARRDHQPLRTQGLDLLDRELVVPIHAHVFPQLPEILHQVIGEGIVIIDH